MNFNITIPQFQFDPSFPKKVDIKNILPFINPIPNLNLLAQSLTNNYKQIFIDSKQKILQNKKQINEFVTNSLRSIQIAEYDCQRNKINNSIKNIKKIEITPEKIAQMRKLETIHNKYNVFAQNLKKALHTFQNNKEHFISDFLLVCEWFISNPRPFCINIESAFPDVSLQFYTQNRDLIKHFSMLEYSLKSQLKYVSLLPDQLFFSSEDMNRNFLKNALQNALNQRKNNTSYFEPLKCEESLYIFFQSRSSPILSKLKELEIIRNFSKPLFRKSGINNENKNENNTELKDFIIKWIKETSLIILNYEEKNQNEKKSEEDLKNKLEAIEIMIVRFVFEFTFPYLDWHPLPDISFSRQIEALSSKTPRNLQIPLNFLKIGLADVECTKIFERDSVSRAAVEWLSSSQYEVCPLRAAYCISKAHESLTVMATIAATENESISRNKKKDSQNPSQIQSSQNLNQNQNFYNSHQNQSSQNSNENQNSQNSNENQNFYNSHQNQSSQNSNDNQSSQNSTTSVIINNDNDDDDSAVKMFFSKVPGFDDIFIFWVCLICSAKLADPRGLNEFIKNWSNLPGFSNRIRAACTYFEAAIVHIESGEAIEKCLK